MLEAHPLRTYSPNSVELDFSHLAEKGVGYARHRSRLKEVIEVRTLPPKMVQVLASFAPLFSKRVFRHAQVLFWWERSSPRAQGRSVPPCVRWVWTGRGASIATTGS